MKKQGREGEGGRKDEESERDEGQQMSGREREEKIVSIEQIKHINRGKSPLSRVN